MELDVPNRTAPGHTNKFPGDIPNVTGSGKIKSQQRDIFIYTSRNKLAPHGDKLLIPHSQEWWEHPSPALDSLSLGSGVSLPLPVPAWLKLPSQ